MNWPFSQCRYAFILLVWNRHIVLFKPMFAAHTLWQNRHLCVSGHVYEHVHGDIQTYRMSPARMSMCKSTYQTVCALLSSSLPRCIWHDSFWCFKTEGPWNGFTVGREREREEDGERKGETVGGGRQRVRWGEQKDRRKDEKAALIKHDKERDGAKEHQPCVHGGGVNTRPCVHVRCHESLYVSEWRQTKLDVGTIKVWRRLSHVPS